MGSILRKPITGSLLALLSASVLGAAALEGRWKLVEQRFGSGRANLASLEAPVRLEFYLQGPSLSGRIWVTGDRSKALPWPAFVSEQGPLPVEVRRLLIGAGNDRARVEYRVALPSDEGDVLEITEEYRIAEEGRALAGSVIVSLIRNGKAQGSYLLHRRFEREP